MTAGKFGTPAAGHRGPPRRSAARFPRARPGHPPILRTGPGRASRVATRIASVPAAEARGELAASSARRSDDFAGKLPTVGCVTPGPRVGVPSRRTNLVLTRVLPGVIPHRLPARSLCRNPTKARTDRSALGATPFQGQQASGPRTACWNATKLHVKHLSCAVGTSLEPSTGPCHCPGRRLGPQQEGLGPTSPDDAPMLHVKPENLARFGRCIRVGRPIFPSRREFGGARTIGWCFTAQLRRSAAAIHHVSCEAERLAGRGERCVSARISWRRRLALHSSGWPAHGPARDHQMARLTLRNPPRGPEW